jgi:hypothetical protein
VRSDEEETFCVCEQNILSEEFKQFLSEAKTFAHIFDSSSW